MEMVDSSLAISLPPQSTYQPSLHLSQDIPVILLCAVVTYEYFLDSIRLQAPWGPWQFLGWLGIDDVQYLADSVKKKIQ